MHLTHPHATSRPDVLPLPFMTQADVLFMLSQGSEAAAYTAKILCKIRALDGTFNTTFLPLTKVNMIRNGTEREGGSDVMICYFSYVLGQVQMSTRQKQTNGGHRKETQHYFIADVKSFW